MLDEEWQEESMNSINFYGFKVLQLKQEADSAWQKAYNALAKAFIDFIAGNKEDATKWNGTNATADFFPT